MMLESYKSRAISKYLICLVLLQINDIQTNSHIALILARGGSKQLPNKNLARIQGKSLLRRTIVVAIASQVFDEIWVSTDDLTIRTEAVFAGAKVYARSEHTASDTATSVEAINEFLNFFPNITTVALLQCTSPFLSSKYLRKAYFMMRNLKYDSMFAATKNFKLLWQKREDGAISPMNFDIDRRPRRQDKHGEYVENGMIYWFRTELARKGMLQGGRIGILEIPSERSIEIDSPVDLTFARYTSREIYPIIEWEKDTCIPEDERG